MNIAIIGNGNIGSGLLKVLKQTQHNVAAHARDDDLGAAVADAEIVILATPYGAAAELAKVADFTGKLVIDVSNPVTADYSGFKSAMKPRPQKRSLLC